MSTNALFCTLASTDIASIIRGAHVIRMGYGEIGAVALLWGVGVVVQSAPYSPM